MNPMTLMTVKLPDGRLALEVETINYGGSETYPSYEYFCDGEEIRMDGFNTDYWGRITNLIEIKQHLDLNEAFKTLSTRLNES